MKNFFPNLQLRLFGLAKIPLIFFLGPRIIEINDQRAEVKIPLTYRSKNHLNSMYFGALSVGADLCIGMIALHHIKKSGKKISLVFKDFKADFTKLAKSDVHFICTEGDKIASLVKKVAESGERHHCNIKGYAIAPKANGTEIIMDFTLALSLK
jgi:acyl-coenzyme A thioesterase PaaI-like protein